MAGAIRDRRARRIRFLFSGLGKEEEKSKKGPGDYNKNGQKSQHPGITMSRGRFLPKLPFLSQLQIEQAQKRFRILFDRFGLAKIGVHR